MTVRDFIKVCDGEFDVYDNYTEELAIAYCGEKLTAAGEEYFKEALDLEIIAIDRERVIVGVDAPNLKEKDVEHRLEKAKELFESMAGYCSESDWDKWFEAGN